MFIWSIEIFYCPFGQKNVELCPYDNFYSFNVYSKKSTRFTYFSLQLPPLQPASPHTPLKLHYFHNLI